MPSLEPLPQTYAATREGLHQVAERIVAPARKPDNEIALEATPGGFGTPAFRHEGRLQRIRVEGADLVRITGEEERRAPLTSLRSAASLVGDLVADASELPDDPLAVEADAALALGEWYALGDSVLREIVAAAEPGDNPSEVHLWPEHFDLAIEIGSEAGGARANFGFSPGDEEHLEPYVYVGPWTAEVTGELWLASGFHGAELGYAELLASEDAQGAALAFCRSRKAALEQLHL